MSDPVRPQRQQPTRLPHPWDSPGKNTGVYIDINGNVIICGRRDDDQLTGVQLTEDELKELFRNPYEL